MKPAVLPSTRVNSFSGALFNHARTHRHMLWRRWATGPRACFICLNPSAADEETNDHSVTKMIGFAQRWKFGALDVVNLFDFITTYPEELKRQEARVASSIHNDGHIVASALRCAKVFCAWGTHGDFQRRARNVVKLLLANDVAPYCLKKNADGSPAHPLRLSYDLRPVRYSLEDFNA